MDHATRGLNLETTFVRRDDFPSLQGEHIAIGEHDREAFDPIARGAVLERRGARRIGRRGSAGSGAQKRRHRRQPRAAAAELVLKGRQWHAGADRHGRAGHLDLP